MHSFQVSRNHLSAHDGRLLGCCKQTQAVRMVPQSKPWVHFTAWREERVGPMVDNQPYILNHSFDVTTMVPEKAIPTNPDTARQHHLLRYHRGYQVASGNRELKFPDFHTQDARLPEGALYHNADAFAGTMAPYIAGSGPKYKLEDPNFGSAYLLSPCVQGPGTSCDVIYLGSAAHNLALAGLRYGVGAATYANLQESALSSLAFGRAFRDLDLPPAAEEFMYTVNDVPPPPEPHPATLAYPALEVPPTAVAPVIEGCPDITIIQLNSYDNFPYNAQQGWKAGMKQDWLVPTFIPEKDALQSCIAIAGVTGTNSNLKQLQDLYGVGNKESAARLAKELSKQVLPAQTLIVSPGDIIADNGLYLYHRASANNGMAGAAVRSITHPQLLLGTHIGACGPYAFNIATSVNHPVWCALYVQNVLPAIMGVSQWPAAYMPSSLAAYLQHHQKMLVDMDLWEQHAEPFVRMHSVHIGSDAV